MPDPSPKTLTAEQLARNRVRALLGRRYLPGQRLPPIKRLARMLGTGQTNTQRAVRQLVAEGLLTAQPSVGTIVCDTVTAESPVPAAVGIDGRDVAILHSQTDTTFARFPQLLRAHLTRAGAQCHTASINGNTFQSHFSAQDDADAVVLINPPLLAPIDLKSHQATLLITTAAENTIEPGAACDVVSVNSQQGGYLAGKHFAELGVERICFVGRAGDHGEMFDVTSATRLRGCMQGFGRDMQADCHLPVIAYMPSIGARAAADYVRMNNRPDGVFCATDDLAVGFVMAAHAFDLQPARDYQLIGFDGQMRGRDLPDGPLTTIDTPVNEMCGIAAQWLIDRVNNPARPARRLQLDCTLFRGATTRR